ncbi:MAG TPA: BlaI/MecI/CopY family transcriptional regulator, partial [Pirellulales bacterium]|nr:BlaI/MecI/CopY family transcriptional regulator [Pirellulales bacterium]
YTVQKLLDRLEAKECAARDRDGRAHTFRATLARGDLLGERLRDLADTICGGSLAPLLTELVRLRKLTPQELKTLEQLVEELAKKGKRR